MPVLEKRTGMVLNKLTDGRLVRVNARICDSSNVESIAWPTSGEPLMLVRYKSGGTYGYLGVSRQRAVAAAYAVSTGRYINSRIKRHFKAVKIA